MKVRRKAGGSGTETPTRCEDLIVLDNIKEFRMQSLSSCDNVNPSKPMAFWQVTNLSAQLGWLNFPREVYLGLVYTMAESKCSKMYEHRSHFSFFDFQWGWHGHTVTQMYMSPTCSCHRAEVRSTMHILYSSTLVPYKYLKGDTKTTNSSLNQ